MLRVEEEEVERTSEEGKKKTLFKRIKLKKRMEYDLTFPTTKILWHPKKTSVLATGGDHLRVWNLDETDDLDKQQEILRNEKHATSLGKNARCNFLLRSAN